MKKRIFIQPLSQLDNMFADYAKDISGVFVGPYLPQPGIVKEPPLSRQYAKLCIEDLEEMMMELGRGILGFKGYIRTGNFAHAERYIEQLARVRQISREIEIRILKSQK